MSTLRARAVLGCAVLALGLALWVAHGERDGSHGTSSAQAPRAANEEARATEGSAPALELRAAAARGASDAPRPEPGTTLELRAIHADGSPAPDIPLTVRTTPGGSQVLQVTTDARGEARVPNASVAILAAAAGSLLEVVPFGILPEPTPVPLHPKRCFEAATIVELPPLAELELRVLRADATLLQRGSAQVMTQAEHRANPSRGSGAERHPWWQPVEGGGARFARLQAEVPLMITALDAEWNLDLLHPHPGLPRGKRTELELRFDRKRLLARARAVDGRSGLPLARTPLHVSWITVETRGSSSSGFVVTPDEQGVFYFVRAARANAVELWLEIGDPRLGHVRRGVPLAIGDGVHDLGDLVIQPFHPRVSGRVVDEQGAPVPRAEVEVRVIVEAPEDTAQLRFEHFAANLTCDEAGCFAWNAPPVSSAPGVEARAKIALRASDATRRSRAEQVSVGARDVVLQLQGLGSFAGRLEVDPRVPFHVLVLEHRLAGQDGSGGWRRILARAPHHIEASGLEPGRYDFRARLEGTEEGAVLVQGIEVRAGACTADRRLDPLDLHTAFAVFDFEIAHPPECLPIDLRFTLTRVGGGGDLRLRGSMVSATRASALAPAGTYDAHFETPGFQPVVLRGLTGGKRVELVPAHALRLRIDASAAVSRTEGALELVLRRAGTGQELVRALDAASDELVVPLSQPGRYELLWRRRLPAAEGAALVALGAGEPAFVEIAPTSPETVVHVTPPR